MAQRGNDLPTQVRILERLVAKAQARDLVVSPDAMGNPEIMRRSRDEYKNLASEIEGDLPRATCRILTLCIASSRPFTGPCPGDG